MTVLVLNDSRGAFVSAGVALVAFLFLRYRVQLPVLLIGMAIMVALAVGVIAKTTGGHAAGDVLRADLWRSAVAMFEKSPLTGVGPGLFGQAYRTYRAGSDDNMTGAHSIYLNILAELGLPGVLASGLTVLVFLRSVPRRRNAKQDALLAALAGVAVHLIFDNFPATNFVFLVNLYAAYLVSSSSQPATKPAWRAAAANPIALLLIVWSFNLLTMDTAQLYYERSLFTGSHQDILTAISIDPDNRLYQIQAARLEGDTARIQQLDPTLSASTRLDVYGIISFGRLFR